ncbi:uncharacterized protein BcabD6B2_38500 [Babesia caballi]|uniref:Uncharacterized protein n=1 Tax=Babesia caballi TaxID=5871 RepID=A0AAV4LXF4_BABCB|nr:hypothetical protein BcabD6B2_38500 [Babesia caballi]
MKKSHSSSNTQTTALTCARTEHRNVQTHVDRQEAEVEAQRRVREPVLPLAAGARVRPAKSELVARWAYRTAGGLGLGHDLDRHPQDADGTGAGRVNQGQLGRKLHAGGRVGNHGNVLAQLERHLADEHGRAHLPKVKDGELELARPDGRVDLRVDEAPVELRCARVAVVVGVGLLLEGAVAAVALAVEGRDDVEVELVLGAGVGGGGGQAHARGGPDDDAHLGHGGRALGEAERLQGGEQLDGAELDDDVEGAVDVEVGVAQEDALDRDGVLAEHALPSAAVPPVLQVDFGGGEDLVFQAAVEPLEGAHHPEPDQAVLGQEDLLLPGAVDRAKDGAVLADERLSGLGAADLDDQEQGAEAVAVREEVVGGDDAEPQLVHGVAQLASEHAQHLGGAGGYRGQRLGVGPVDHVLPHVVQCQKVLHQHRGRLLRRMGSCRESAGTGGRHEGYGGDAEGNVLEDVIQKSLGGPEGRRGRSLCRLPAVTGNDETRRRVRPDVLQVHGTQQTDVLAGRFEVAQHRRHAAEEAGAAVLGVAVLHRDHAVAGTQGKLRKYAHHPAGVQDLPEVQHVGARLGAGRRRGGVAPEALGVERDVERRFLDGEEVDVQHAAALPPGLAHRLLAFVGLLVVHVGAVRGGGQLQAEAVEMKGASGGQRRHLVLGGLGRLSCDDELAEEEDCAASGELEPRGGRRGGGGGGVAGGGLHQAIEDGDRGLHPQQATTAVEEEERDGDGWGRRQAAGGEGGSRHRDGAALREHGEAREVALDLRAGDARVAGEHHGDSAVRHGREPRAVDVAPQFVVLLQHGHHARARLGADVAARSAPA